MGDLISVTPSPGSVRSKKGTFFVRRGPALELLLGEDGFIQLANQQKIFLGPYGESAKAKRMASLLGAKIKQLYPKLWQATKIVLSLPDNKQTEIIEVWSRKSTLE